MKGEVKCRIKGEMMLLSYLSKHLKQEKNEQASSDIP